MHGMWCAVCVTFCGGGCKQGEGSLLCYRECHRWKTLLSSKYAVYIILIIRNRQPFFSFFSLFSVFCCADGFCFLRAKLLSSILDYIINFPRKLLRLCKKGKRSGEKFRCVLCNVLKDDAFGGKHSSLLRYFNRNCRGGYQPPA